MSANGTVDINLSWQGQIWQNPNFDLELWDGATRVDQSAISFPGFSRESIDYQVSGLAAGQTKVLTVKVIKVSGANASFTIGNDILGDPSNYPTFPTVGFELRNAATSATVATATPNGQNASSLTGAVTAGTAYKLWATTTDNVSVAETQSVPDLAYAPLILEVLNPNGTPIASTSGATGSLSLPSTLVSDTGIHKVRVTNNSTSASTHPATPNLSWSATTRGADVQSGALATSATSTEETIVAAANGALSGTLTWSKDPGEANFASMTLKVKDAGGNTLYSPTSSTGSLTLSGTVTSGATYKVSVTNNSSTQKVRSFTRTVTVPAQAAVKLSIVDTAGHAVATGQGLKPLTLTAGLAPGNYTAITTATSGAGTATLTGTFSGRPPAVLIGYDANDHATTIDDGTSKVTETLAPSGRVLRRVVTPSGGGASTEDTLFFYDDSGDSPAYTQSTAGGPLTTYLGGAIDVAGVITYQHANGHGDVVGTSNSAGVFTERPASDEYGLDTATPPDRLGWLGKQQRFTEGAANLTRMGVRLYDPTAGRFTAVDPVPGGNENDYDYPADPVNRFDLDGRQGDGCIDASRHKIPCPKPPKHGPRPCPALVKGTVGFLGARSVFTGLDQAFFQGRGWKSGLAKGGSTVVVGQGPSKITGRALSRLAALGGRVGKIAELGGRVLTWPVTVGATIADYGWCTHN